MAQPAENRSTPRAASPQAAGRPARADRRREQTPRRRLVADRVARWVVTAGGLAIIVAILGVLFFIFAEGVPLTRSPRVAALRTMTAPGGPGAPLAAIVVDEHREVVAGLSPDGSLMVLSARDGRLLD